MPQGSHPDLTIVKFVCSVEGQEDKEIQVEGVDEVKVKIPENSKYTMTIFFKVNNNELKDLKYVQVMKKHGLTVKQRDMFIGESYSPSEEIYSKTFEQDVTPGGFLVRGVYPATSTYSANGETLFTSDWSLEITKK